ncbi:hypothetical protein [Streptomyces zaomyceticus]|uniref:hypothetical protein n=1 Tax=Streptomyces zaomyceticus TaxID=68286 RepID=UPI00341C39C6
MQPIPTPVVHPVPGGVVIVTPDETVGRFAVESFVSSVDDLGQRRTSPFLHATVSAGQVDEEVDEHKREIEQSNRYALTLGQADTLARSNA